MTRFVTATGRLIGSDPANSAGKRRRSRAGLGTRCGFTARRWSGRRGSRMAGPLLHSKGEQSTKHPTQEFGRYSLVSAETHGLVVKTQSFKPHYPRFSTGAAGLETKISHLLQMLLTGFEPRGGPYSTKRYHLTTKLYRQLQTIRYRQHCRRSRRGHQLPTTCIFPPPSTPNSTRTPRRRPPSALEPVACGGISIRGNIFSIWALARVGGT